MKTLTTCVAIAMFAWAPLALAQTGKTSQHTATTAPAATPTQAGPAAKPAATPAKDDRTTSETIRGYTVERRDQAIAAARHATDELDRQMERLQTQMSEGWSRMGTASRDRSEKAMTDLRRRRNALAEWVGGMKHGSSGAWSEVRGGFARSYDELAAALRKARSQFEQGRQQKVEPAKPADERPEAKKGH